MERVMRGNTAEETDNQARVVQTGGKVFPDGSVLELVSTDAGNKPSLLSWKDGQDPKVASEVERDGTIYQPPVVDRSIWASTTLPTGIVDRGPSANLFRETRQLVETHVGVSTNEAALATSWNATTWFADILPKPVTLFIHGAGMDLAMRLLWLLSCLARHALIVTEMNRTAFYSLMAVRPTLLLNQPQMSSRFHAMCCASNYRGLVLPGRNGSVVDVVSAKAIFVGTAARSWNDGGLHLHLPASPRNLRPLDEATQVEIKERFQPWYLAHRLSNLPQVRQSRFAGGGLASSTSEVSRVLQSCTRNSGPLKLQWALLLRSQEQDARAARYWDPLAAMLEVLWPRIHSSEKSLSMKELTGLANTLLRSRGETREYSPEESGKKLGNEGVLRRRMNSGMVLMFDRQTLRRLHQLARNLGVEKKVTKGRDCKELQIAGE
jgi:hypothetical protein